MYQMALTLVAASAYTRTTSSVPEGLQEWRNPLYNLRYQKPCRLFHSLPHKWSSFGILRHQFVNFTLQTLRADTLPLKISCLDCCPVLHLEGSRGWWCHQWGHVTLDHTPYLHFKVPVRQLCVDSIPLHTTPLCNNKTASWTAVRASSLTGLTGQPQW